MSTSNKRSDKNVADLIKLQELFKTRKGTDVLYDLCRTFHYFQTSYTGNVNDAIFREGERNVINYIMSKLQQDPAKLLSEFRRRQKEELEYELD